MSEAWYYAEGSQQQGPVSEQDLLRLLFSGRIPLDTLVWTARIVNWTPASQVPCLVGNSAAPPAAVAAPQHAAAGSGATEASGMREMLRTQSSQPEQHDGHQQQHQQSDHGQAAAAEHHQQQPVAYGGDVAYGATPEGYETRGASTSTINSAQSNKPAGSQWGEPDAIGVSGQNTATPGNGGATRSQWGEPDGIGAAGQNTAAPDNGGGSSNQWGNLDAIGAAGQNAAAPANGGSYGNLDAIGGNTGLADANFAEPGNGGNQWGTLDTIGAPASADLASTPSNDSGGASRWGNLDSIPTPAAGTQPASAAQPRLTGSTPIPRPSPVPTGETSNTPGVKRWANTGATAQDAKPTKWQTSKEAGAESPDLKREAGSDTSLRGLRNATTPPESGWQRLWSGLFKKGEKS